MLINYSSGRETHEVRGIHNDEVVCVEEAVFTGLGEISTSHSPACSYI